MKVDGTFNLRSCVFSDTPNDAYITNNEKYWDKWRPCSGTSSHNNDKTVCSRWSDSVLPMASTGWFGCCSMGGTGEGPSLSEKWATNTRILTKAVRTSAVGHSRMYSQNRDGWAKRTFWQNQARTCLEYLRCWVRASYHSWDEPRSVFFVWKPELNKNLDASWKYIF